jgi:hypothetical protein
MGEMGEMERGVTLIASSKCKKNMGSDRISTEQKLFLFIQA